MVVLCAPRKECCVVYLRCLSVPHAPDERLVIVMILLCALRREIFTVVSLWILFLPMYQIGGYSQCDDLTVCSPQRHLHCVSLDFFYPCTRSEASW